MAFDHPETTPRETAGGEAAEEVSEEEAEWMRNDLIAKARSVQQLMRTLKDNEERLKEDVQDFLLREVAEHQVTAALVSRVEEQQRRCLSDPEYLRWASANEKGEFSADTTAPPHAERSAGGQFLTQHRAVVASIPPAVVANLAGWTSNEWSPATQLFVAELQTQGAALFGGDDFAVLVNGIPLFDTHELTEPWRHPQILRKNAFSRDDGPGDRWRKWMNVVGAVAGKAPVADRLRTSPSVKAVLQVEDDNTICLVQFRHLAAAVPLRVYVFCGAVAAVETMDQRLNLFRIQGLDAAASIHRAAECVRTELQVSGSSGKHYLFSLLVDGDGECVVTHRQPLSPEAPYSFHYSWSDLCGIGRGIARMDAADLAALAPQVRRTDFDTASWQEYDSVTATWFPLLSGQGAPSEQRRGGFALGALGLTVACAVLGAVQWRRNSARV